MGKFAGILITILGVLMLTACGDKAFTVDSNAAGGDTNTDTGIGGDTQTDTGVSIGSGTGGSFTSGTLDIAITSLAAGGSTTVNVTLQAASGALHTESATIVFSSPCFASGTARFEENTVATTTITTSTGIGSINYVAQGCSGSDTITATTTIDGTTLTASGAVTVAPALLGSIQFISASPTLIALKGTGGTGLSESATVIFKVIDETGGPVAGQDVTFSLNTTVGGLSITPATATSSTDGTVQTTVQSGAIPTSVRVTASIATPAISTQSDQLAVSTGIPDQDSFSLSATILNPEGLNRDGETVIITARLADRFNNPVPDNTTVVFSTEGGSIEGDCKTVAGACSVTWTSQNPRPCGQVSGSTKVVLQPSLGPNVCVTDVGTNGIAPAPAASFGQPYGGRATIIASTQGEESFIDVDGDGYFSDGDFYTDLPEAWRDDNEDGVRDTNEQYVDFDESGDYTAADNLFNGILCSHSTLCSTTTTVSARQNLVLIMSGSAPYIEINGGSAVTGLAPEGIATIGVEISDVHNQPLPYETTAEVTCVNGSISRGSNFTLLSTNFNGPVGFSFTYKAPALTAPATTYSDSCVVEVQTPKGSPNAVSVSISGP